MTVAREPRVIRTDIQALRAIAIGLVVLNHLWPLRLTGGYVGVDVFFVISGFLITGHLVGEINRTGHVRLGAFYARRVRRLLPAAFLVLAVSLAFLVAFLPYPRWDRNAWEIAASAGYVENWFLAAMSVNYSALNDAASLVQHYWSLSVEEQFYIIWPLLLIAAVAFSRRRGARMTRRGSRVQLGTALLTVVAAVGILSLGASIVYTIIAPAQAYFATFTRGWEFAVGGVVALIGARLPLGRMMADCVSLFGFALIAFSALTYDHTTGFPGYAAIAPVLGTAMVILAGNVHAPLWHSRITALKPIQWVGGVSYSLYLWHWPLIVVVPFAVGSEMSTISKLAVLALSLVLAELTKRYVEDRGQRWRFWHSSPRRSLSLMVAGMVLIGVLVASVLSVYNVRAAADRPPEEVVATSCEGPLALAPQADCRARFGPADYTVMTEQNVYSFTPKECAAFLPILTYGERKTTMECDFSGGAENPTRVWLVGDSHAQQWQGAIFDIARDHHWIVTTSYFGGCPVADINFVGFREPWTPSDAELCETWARDLSKTIQQTEPDLVVTAMASRQQTADDGSGEPSALQMEQGLVEYWGEWSDRGTRVLALADPPLNGEVRSPDCVVLNVDAPLECARPRGEAQPPDPLVSAATAVGSELVRSLDLTDRFCDDASCYAVVGGIPVYYDADHLNLEYVRMLGTEIGAAAEELLEETG